jgi:hypothetical protein
MDWRLDWPRASETRGERARSIIRYALCEFVAQRVFSIACGYPDVDDSAHLPGDPIHKLLLDRDPIEGHELASQPTLSRFENGVGVKELVYERHRARCSNCDAATDYALPFAPAAKSNSPPGRNIHTLAT